MIRKLSLGTVSLALLIGASGCVDLDVVNPNNPDRARALASPDDVEALIAGAYAAYWGVAHYWRSGVIAMDVTSNHGSSAWGNFGMNDIGREPREPLRNTSSYTYRYIFEVPWEGNYSAIAGASDGLRALAEGLDIGPGGERNARATAFAKFMQGLGGCFIALTFDQAFLVDDQTDLAALVSEDPLPYNQVMDFYVAKLNEAETLARGNSFTLEDGWINGNPLTNQQFADLIMSYRARCRANLARTPAENASAPWSSIVNDAANGLGDLTIEGNEAGADAWWDGIKTLGGSEMATWNRSHMDHVGQSDVSGTYQAWLAIPTASRTAMALTSPDLRMPAVNVDGEQGVYHRYNATVIGRAERGTYRFSFYGDHRWEDYLFSCSFCYFGPIAEMLPVEMDLIQAEGAVEMGNTGAAIALLNNTRVGNGGLPPLVDAGTVPGGAACVPRKRFNLAGTCGDLRDALRWEHMEEIFQLSGGLSYFFLRGQGSLPTATAIHFPIPAKDLETLQLDIYTFGGGAGGEQPRVIPIIPGDLNNALERARYALDRIEARRAELNGSIARGLEVR